MAVHLGQLGTCPFRNYYHGCRPSCRVRLHASCAENHACAPTIAGSVCHFVPRTLLVAVATAFTCVTTRKVGSASRATCTLFHGQQALPRCPKLSDPGKRPGHIKPSSLSLSLGVRKLSSVMDGGVLPDHLKQNVIPNAREWGILTQSSQPVYVS